MNKLDKKIIEYIEPYTDKTLSKWCYIETILWVEQIYKSTWKWLFQVIYSKTETKINYIEWQDEFKIIWHYDITAVLKYIKKLWYWVSGELETITIIWRNKFWNIPNKPLSLYTDKQKQELIDLFDKLEKDD